MDELYSYDGMNQLATFARGQLTSDQTALAAGTETFAQAWSLDPTGNWSEFQQDSTGSGTWDLDQPRTHNAVNEITAFGDTSGPQWAVAGLRPGRQHDRAAASRHRPRTRLSCTYDAWNRLVLVADASSGATVAQISIRRPRLPSVARRLRRGRLTEVAALLLFGPVAGLASNRRSTAVPRIGNSSGACVTSTTWCFATATPPATARSTSGSTPCKTPTGTSRRFRTRPALWSSVTATRPTASRRSSRESFPRSPRPRTT